MTHRTLLRSLAAAALLGAAACTDPAGPPVVPGDQLVFIRQAPGAPALQANEISFWAKRGDNAEVRMPYVNGHECLRFKIPGDALLRYPNGTRFADGDSVRITIRLVDASRYNFEFEPSGLQFDRDHPAELRISYGYADPDVDGDGDVDARDEMEFENAAIWKQEVPSAPWTRVGTARVDATEEMRADLTGFTRYALASN